MPTLTLHRTGAFTVKTTGLHHCGTSDILSIAYTLDVKCDDSQLDSRGFLFDQLNIQKYFDSIQTTDLSCELLTRHSAREIYRIIRRENDRIKPTALSLSLLPAPYVASMTFAWESR